MNNTFPDVSAKQLLADESWTLQKAINEATDHAKTVLNSGEFVRTKLREGNMNSSLESTTQGALNVANNIAGRFCLDEQAKIAEPPRNAFFGENLRRTIAAFKVLGRK